MKQELRAIRGMNDVAPPASARWQRLERRVADVLAGYGYQQIRLPIVEATGVFERSIGDTTDIVQKEMYTFADRNGDSLTLRPEGTAGCVRAVLEHGLLHQQPQLRLWYTGPMFRHERPQKGRHRQFYQVGAELIGREDPLGDAELLLALWDVLDEVGVQGATLLLNSLGDEQCRPTYRELLRAFGHEHLGELCENCKRRLDKNPLRILDCKEEGCRAATAGAPRLTDHLCAPCADHFARVKSLLDAAGVAYEVDWRLVRGLDYYVRTTFEVLGPGLGSQSAIGAGGRYDGLVAQIGGPPVSGIGFAFGVDRLVLALQASRPDVEGEVAAELAPDVFIAPLGAAAEAAALTVAHRLRQAGVRVELDGGRSLKSLMRRADKLKARQVMILGEEELAQRRATMRDMEAKQDRKLAVDIDLTGDELLAAVGARAGRRRELGDRRTA